MRHGIAGNKLGRKTAHRKATVRDIAKATLIQQRICTTKAKAKEARKLVDKLITMGKKGTLAEKRRAFAVLCDHKLVSDLFNNTAKRFDSRKGGYTRIIPLGNRRGDNAELAFLELTEKTEVIVSEAPASTTAKTTAKKPAKTAKKPTDKEPEAPAAKDKKKNEVKSTATSADKAKTQKKGGLKNIFKRKAT